MLDYKKVTIKALAIRREWVVIIPKFSTLQAGNDLIRKRQHFITPFEAESSIFFFLSSLVENSFKSLSEFPIR